METQKIRLMGRSRQRPKKYQPVPFASCKEKNISVYLHLLDAREKLLRNKTYPAWNYCSKRDIIEDHIGRTLHTNCENSGGLEESVFESTEGPPGHITSVSFTKLTEDNNRKSAKSAKKVAFSVKEKNGTNETPEKFPYIEPSSRASSQTRAITKLSDVTFNSKQPARRKSNLSTTTTSSKDSELFQITFRGFSRESHRRYDPRSEMHSDYYSIKKISRNSKPLKYEKQISFPETTKSFQAILMGSPKRMVKKYDESNLTIPFYSWNKVNKVSNFRGYTSAPIF